MRNTRRSSGARRTGAGLVGVAVVGAIYWYVVRKWYSNWGATSEECERAMAGDHVIAHPTHKATGAITIDAPPECIWPWLVQMGTGRGGLYSYDRLDRVFGFLDRPSSSRVLAEYQHPEVGDKVPWGRDELTVAVLDPGKALALSMDAHGMEWVWQFGLYPIDDQRTRLVQRGIERVPHTPKFMLFMAVMEPASFIMTRKFMLGVKQRAESLVASPRGATWADTRR